jgi:hypothetical protein
LLLVVRWHRLTLVLTGLVDVFWFIGVAGMLRGVILTLVCCVLLVVVPMIILELTIPIVIDRSFGVSIIDVQYVAYLLDIFVEPIPPTFPKHTPILTFSSNCDEILMFCIAQYRHITWLVIGFRLRVGESIL